MSKAYIKETHQNNITENGISVICTKKRCETLSLCDKNRPLRKESKDMPRQSLLRNLEQKMTLHCNHYYQYITQNPNLLSLLSSFFFLNKSFFFFFLFLLWFYRVLSFFGFWLFNNPFAHSISLTHKQYCKAHKMKYKNHKIIW